MIKPLFAAVLFACSCIPVSAQKIAELTVPAEGLTPGMEQPLAIDLDHITLLPDTTIALVEVKKGKREPVPFQIEHKGKRTLHWIIQQDNRAKRVFELINTTPPQAAAPMHISKDTGALVIAAGSKKLLQYNYKTTYPPPGVDTAFKRSGFIHPLWTPHGQALTRLSPSDHYHHFGLWNPWTKLHFQGQTYDCWNLRDKQGTVRYAGFVSVNEGPVYGDYQVLHQHVVFTKTDGEKTAIDELQSVRIYQPAGASDYYLMDITIQLNCATDSPVVLKAYRYGGLGWRATEKWNKNNSEILTSEGKSRREADGTKARWAIVQGSLDSDYGGAVMMSYPTNYNYPEPLRIWPENVVGNGDVYANFFPCRDKDWVLTPGQDHVLKYRFLVFNGKFNSEKAEAAWRQFAHPPKVTVKVLASK